MTNYSTGHLAEQHAAEYLKSRGYEILDINWKTKYCEIDIVAKKAKTVYFVEVKYRKSDVAGSGLEYITDKKLKRMRFAAEIWISNNNYSGNCSLAAIEVSGPDFEVTNFLAEI